MTRLQVAEVIARGGDVRTAKAAYYADPRCSCCEAAPVSPGADLCDECFSDACRVLGSVEEVRALMYTAAFRRGAR